MAFQQLKRDILKSQGRFICQIFVIQHFCLPTSGRPLIREITKELKLGENEDEAALMTLHRFGNQSSSSLWYEVA
jgi:3-ketoacyl-CoA synthase